MENEAIHISTDDSIRSLKICSSSKMEHFIKSLNLMVQRLNDSRSNVSTGQRFPSRRSVQTMVSNLTSENVREYGLKITKRTLRDAYSLTKTMRSQGETICDLFSDIANKSSVCAIRSAKDVSQNAIGQTSNFVNQFETIVGDSVSELVDESSSQTTIDQILGSTFSDDVVGVVSSLSTSFIHGQSESSSQLNSDVVGLKNQVSQLVEEQCDGIHEYVKQLSTELVGSQTGDALTELVFNGQGTEDVTTFDGGLFYSDDIDSLKTELNDRISNLSDKFTNTASVVIQSIVDNSIDSLSRITDCVSSYGNDLGSYANSTSQLFVSRAKSVAESFITQVGKIVQGEMSSSASGIEKLSNFTSNSIGSIEDILDSSGNLTVDPTKMSTKLSNDALNKLVSISNKLVELSKTISHYVVGVADGSVSSLIDNIIQNDDGFVTNVCNGVDEINSKTNGIVEKYEVGYQGSEEEDDESDEYEDREYDGVRDGTQYSIDSDSDSNSDNTTSDDDSSDYGDTTPTGNDTVYPDKGLVLKADQTRNAGWEGYEVDVVNGILGLMHDGDQQLFNPYGEHEGIWTTYSFRPKDTTGGEDGSAKMFPQIAITPASFMALDSIDTMLDNIPFIVIKEYFFKNTASTMVNFVKKLMDQAKEADAKAKADTEAKNESQDASSSGSSDAKSTGNTLLDKIKETFQTVPLSKSVIDIPYVLYCGLRKKLYGNTYVFPYLVQEDGSSLINQSSNQGQWEKGGSGSIIDAIKEGIQHAAHMIGGIATSAMGSNAKVADLFPAPTWNGSQDGNVEFSFDLMLINDHVVKARNNYMCVNTIIHNNRAIQKAILNFPGALYELWLPTGQRHLMCTADLKLYPLGLNRLTPDQFFEGGAKGADFTIGTSNKQVAEIKTPHKDGVEVIPDGYKLNCTFRSCLANNMNVAVFQYYVKMADYDSYSSSQTGGSESTDDVWAKAQDAIGSAISGSKDSATKAASGTPTTTTSQTSKDAKVFSRAVSELADEYTEKFDEATYNKKLGKLKSYFGDIAINADSAVVAIRNSQRVITESNSFLKKLYNAENNNLWYKPFETEEYYTTLKPDYKQILSKRYRDKFKSLRNIDEKLNIEIGNLNDVESKLTETIDFDKRDSLLKERVRIMRKMNVLQTSRDETSEELLKIDVDLIDQAFNEHDSTVSVKKNGITSRIFSQVWNEKIMNSYEKDKLQYMTSKEKEIYFSDKIRELGKYDTYGILNHSDWFFRVVVLDYIVSEMQKLILLFKSCTYDDFETIYKVVRKLNLLNLDIEQIRSNDQFDINNTNLFYLSDEDIRKFTKIDNLLTGNTLYELFTNQMKIKFVQVDATSTETVKQTDKELIQEQTSEMDTDKLRTRRQDIVNRVWGNETELTKAAYDKANSSTDTTEITIDVEGDVKTFSGLKSLKDRIINLKLTNDNPTELRILLGAFANQVLTIKEGLVLEKMKEMTSVASDEISTKDGSVNAKTI